MKSLAKTLFVIYLLILGWLILFKLSYDIISVILHYQTQQVNLIPFIGSSKGEMISNFVVFIPLGLLLSINFRRLTFWHKFAMIFGLSVSLEIVQYILAIGVTDATDLLTNTLGGVLGLITYHTLRRFIHTKKLDLVILICGLIITTLFVILRLFVFKVQY